MEAEIQALKAKIANAKRKITNFSNFITNYNAENDIHCLERRKQDADNVFTQFETWYSELEEIAEDPSHATIRTEYEEKYYTAFGKAVSFLKVNVPLLSNSQESLASTSTQNTVHEVPVNQLTNSKQTLPRLNLPSFSGSYESWLGFHDLFKSLVDDNKNIPDIEKLYHLKGCLREEALDVLASIELSGENYKVAWELLKERYDNRKLIRQTHVKALVNIQHMSRDFPVRSLLDQLQKHLRALEALKEPVDKWNSILIEIITQKLNPYTREKWDDYSCELGNPTIKEFITFLQRRAQCDDNKSYQNIGKSQNSNEKKSSRFNSRPQQSFAMSFSKKSCSHCQGEHLIYYCEAFKKLSTTDRFESAKKANLCINCLRPNHRVIDCKASPCRRCHKKHNALLHFEKSISEETPSTSENIPETKALVGAHVLTSNEGLLATAIVDLVNDQGESKVCRVFLDGGSQANFITKNVASYLNLPRNSIDISISGVEKISTKTKHSVVATMKSRFNKFSKKLEFLVLNEITQPMPSIYINRTNLEIPKNIVLADPEFHKPSGIDILIGVKLFYKLLCVGQFALKNHPDAVLQKTQLGWIVAGEISGSSLNTHLQSHLVRNTTPLEINLTKFWEIEEVASKRIMSKEEQACEVHFQKNTRRDSSGKYIVKLPFNENKEKLGESYGMALSRFQFLEKRLEKNSDLKTHYCQFLKEYENLGHLSLIKNKNLALSGVYLPHHAVIKEDSITTKIRVVFDGSAKTTTGISLNDALMTGPTIQDDLFTLLVRFRSHAYVLTADIEKMYRQILVHPDDIIYQKILFRDNSHESVNEFTLNTVTYGTSCAPFLAIRTLHQLADDEGFQYPDAAAVLKKDFYVDDLLTGASTHQEALNLRDNLTTLLQKGGFVLRKWASNDPSLVPDQLANKTADHLSLNPNVPVKTLGIHWNSQKDVIFYEIKISSLYKIFTKRAILSTVAKLFDPLGLLGPIIIVGKLVIQLLWKAGISWDESVPQNIHTLWLEFLEQLPLLNKIEFNRPIIAFNSVNLQIHGFCDASEKAYGACIYLRSTDSLGKHHVSLICSKSRVAPVNPVTLPRLELCASLLLSRLFTSIKRSFRWTMDQVFLWSDSTVTLHWINTEPHLLKTFVSNRVAEIRNLSENCEWRHVPTQHNPADFISRGQSPQDFLNNIVWRHGPAWLSQPQQEWPQEIIQLREVPEKRTTTISTVCVKENNFNDLFFEKFSSLTKINRIMAYVLRFINNTKNKVIKQSGPLNAIEIELSAQKVILLVQKTLFSKEIKSLQEGKFIDYKSSLISLKPFLDKNEILRVGGRLKNSDLPYDKKHQILLPAKHHVTKLIIREEHERLKHAGSQATLYSVREQFWPIDGRNITRSIIHKCVRCFRARPRGSDYVMGDLPQERVSYTRPFHEVGVDYCGPFFIKERRFRNRNKLKVYVAIFICMSTKAVHLELVSDLTSEAFIACLKRLFSRRGISQTIHSDNATNFVGASRELVDLYKLLQSSEYKTDMNNFLSQQKINWNFIPPRAPHFGGLWEAAVKSFKHHLTRTVGDTLLTYEQLETLIIEIEAILNSRPISPMSPDPNDLQPLTPGHFLIGGPLTSFPQLDLADTPTNRLSSWQHAQKLRQHFWNRWYKEYLHQLTVRSKWQLQSSQDLTIGTMVIIKEDNLPPLKWKLGRILATHPGSDGVIRVVTLKTDTGEFKRCVKKLCPLPIESSD